MINLKWGTMDDKQIGQFVGLVVVALSALLAWLKAWQAARMGQLHRDECIAYARASRTEVFDELSRIVMAQMEELHRRLQREMMDVIMSQLADIRKKMPDSPRQG